MVWASTARAEEPGQPRVETSTQASDDPGGDYLPAELPRGARLLPKEERPGYRNPQGTLPVSGHLALSTGPLGTQFSVGLGLGYAVLTGVVPGVRGLLIAQEGVGGEVAATLTLTPPLSLNWTPFVIGEAGRRFQPGAAGWIYGAGAGVFLGDPGSATSIQFGWMLRRFAVGDTVYAANGPIIAINWRL